MVCKGLAGTQVVDERDHTYSKVDQRSCKTSSKKPDSWGFIGGCQEGVQGETESSG